MFTRYQSCFPSLLFLCYTYALTRREERRIPRGAWSQKHMHEIQLCSDVFSLFSLLFMLFFSWWMKTATENTNLIFLCVLIYVDGATVFTAPNPALLNYNRSHYTTSDIVARKET